MQRISNESNPAAERRGIQANKNKILFAGLSDPETARKLSEKAKIPFGEILIKKFASGEKYINLVSKVKNKNVYIYQTGTLNPDEVLLETFLMSDAAKRAGAQKIILIMPFLLYSRQDKKTKEELNEPISADALAKLVESAGIKKIITCHIHSNKILGFYDIEILNIDTCGIFGKKLKEIIEKYREKKSNFVVVAPDHGGLDDVGRLAKILGGLKVFYFEKRRADPRIKMNISALLKFYGNVLGKRVIIFDDIVDTGGTVIKAKEELIKKGALEVILCATHPVLSGDALERLTKANFSRIIVSDSIPLKDKSRKLEVISLTDELSRYL